MNARIAVLLCLSFITATSLHAADRMQIGKWEYKITTKGKTGTIVRCVPAEEVAAVNGDAKTARAIAEKTAKNGCVLKTYDIKGDTVTFIMNCDGIVMDSTATFHGDTYVSVLKTTGQGVQSTTAISARRIGACQ
jgi:hypothetical protein